MVSDRKEESKSARGGGDRRRRFNKKDWNPSSLQYKKFFADRTCFICNKRGHGKQHCPQAKSDARVNNTSSTSSEKVNNSGIVTPASGRNKRKIEDPIAFTPIITAKATMVQSPCKDAIYREFSESEDESDQ
jgi:hypothetical protein